MCGITGWIAYDRDLTGCHERDVVAAMTATLACRGPDAEGVWADAHAAFGHRRLAVIDPAGGRQPMAADIDGRTVVVTTYSGELYNYRELRRELEHRGHRFHTASDTEVMLRAYLAWGEDFTVRLNGMYALALWDTRVQEGLLVRDRLGIKPLYYYPTASGVLFGSEPKAMLAHPEVEATVDTDGLRHLLILAKTPGHSVYAGMREVRPGHTVRVGHHGVSEHRYWGLTAREHTDDLQTTISTVRCLLEDITARQLIADVPVCTLLSGGLDSSALTALAARTLREQGRGAVRSFAVDFAGRRESFTPSPLRPTPDIPYARALAAHVSADHTDVVLEASDLSAYGNRRAVLRARDLPSLLGDTDTSLYLLFKAVREHSTVALSGEAADEVFGGYRWFHDPVATAADTFPWLAAAGISALALDTALLDRGLLHRLDLEGHQRAHYRRALREVPHPDGTDATEHRMREICYLALTRSLPLLLERKDRMSMATGLEVRVPFCDHQLVEYLYNTPWSMKTFDGREKSLLRAAVRDLLPDAVAQRKKSPYPSTQDRGYARAVRTELARLLDDPNAPVHGLLDGAATQEALTTTDPDSMRRGAELVLGLDGWLREYGVRLTL
ncbi:asparagine synthase (glutamine-hydrolyzing) [Streptomyces sp. NPDC003027]